MKKIILLVTSIICTSILFTGCSNNKSSSTKSSSTSFVKEDSAKKETITKDKASDLDKFEIKNLDGEIIDIVNREAEFGDTLILTSKHKVYKYDYINKEATYIFDVNDKAEKLYNPNGQCVGTVNLDGTYSFYAIRAEYTYYGTKDPYYNKKYENVNISDKLVHSNITSLGGELRFYTLKDSKLYGTIYNGETEEKEYDNKPINIEITAYGKTVENTDEIVEFYQSSPSEYILLSDYNLYELPDGVSMEYNKDTDAIMIGCSLITPVVQLSNMNKNFGMHDGSIIYSLKGEKNKVYFTEGRDDTNSINLPNEYKDEDIKQLLYFDDTAIVEMNDDTIVFYDDIDSNPDGEILDEATKLNKDKHILKLSYIDYDTPVALCDDNYLYIIN